MSEYTIQSEEKSWKTNWTKINTLRKGGQGDSYRVKPNGNQNESTYFLKSLKDKKSLTARERMHTEVAFYEILDFSSIPKLIESNAHQFRNMDFELYLVTEFVEGSTLDNINSTPTLEDIFSCILKLCEIVSYFHSKNMVHRDIKPGNIILRDNEWHDPVLVDFGISNFDINISTEKSIVQEIGNRFLRLPEFSVDSSLKRDPRSDVTFCAGIFYYLLTNTRPVLLLDEKQCMPHQRVDIIDKFKVFKNKIDISKLLTFFDQAFSYKIDLRFQRIEELSACIQDLLIEKKEQAESDLQEKATRINAIINSPTQESNRKTILLLEKIIQILNETVSDVSRDFNYSFNTVQSGYAIDPINFKVQTTLGLTYKLNPNLHTESTYNVYLAGNEIILAADQLILLRFTENERLDVNKIKDIIKQHLITNVDTMLNSNT